MQKKTCVYIIFLIIIIALSACTKYPGSGEIVNFEMPDMNKDYCGPILNKKYCQCAFIGDYCDDVGLTRSKAKEYANGGFVDWIEKQKTRFKTECENKKGIYYSEEAICVYCDDFNGYINKDNNCVKP